MKTHWNHRLTKVLDAVHRLYSARDAETLPQTHDGGGRSLVPGANLSFDTVDFATGQATALFDRPIPISHDESLRHWQVYCQQHPGIQFLAQGGQASVVTVTDFMSQRQFRRTAVYHEIFKVCGGGYQIGVILPNSTSRRAPPPPPTSADCSRTATFQRFPAMAGAAERFLEAPCH